MWVLMKIISTLSAKDNILEEAVHLKPEATCKLINGDRPPSFLTANPGIPQYKDCPFPKGQQGGQMRSWGREGKRNSYPILGGQPMIRGLALFQYLGIQWWEASTPRPQSSLGAEAAFGHRSLGNAPGEADRRLRPKGF